MKQYLVWKVLALGLSTLPLAAQWLNYPTPGIPRLPNGKPNLAAPAPRSVDGNPDLSGLWKFGTGGSSDYLAGVQIPPEILDIATGLKAPLPLGHGHAISERRGKQTTARMTLAESACRWVFCKTIPTRFPAKSSRSRDSP